MYKTSHAHHPPTASYLEARKFPSFLSMPNFFPMATSKNKAALQVSPSARNISPNMEQLHYGHLQARASRGYYKTFYLVSGLPQDHPISYHRSQKQLTPITLKSEFRWYHLEFKGY